jgi:hypothetical protein
MFLKSKIKDKDGWVRYGKALEVCSIFNTFCIEYSKSPKVYEFGVRLNLTPSSTSGLMHNIGLLAALDWRAYGKCVC